MRPSFYPARPLYPINNTLDVDTDGNHDARIANHGERGNQVNAVSLLCGLGVDGALERQQDFGSGGNRVRLGRRGGRRLDWS